MGGLSTKTDECEPADPTKHDRRGPYRAKLGRSPWRGLLVIGVVVMAAACGTKADPVTAQTASTTTTPSSSTLSSALPSTALRVDPDEDSGNSSQNPAADDADDDDMEDPSASELPTDADSLALALTEAERAVRDASLGTSRLGQWGRRQQALYRRLAFHPEWLEPVLDSVDPDVRETVALNWEARENLIALLATEKLHDTMPAWRVEEPPPAAELLSYYKEAEALTGISWEYVAAINLVETRMGRIQGVSTAGAIGPMQFLPTTWAECCEGDPTNPRDAIIGAATYLTVRGGPDNMAKAIWGYNNSDYYVNAVTAYATVMMADERAYHGYHGWGIYFLTTEGVVAIPVGYEQEVEVPVVDWLREHPEALITG